MSQRIQSRISIFDECNFPREPMIGVVILRVTRCRNIKIIGFDPIVVEVGSIVVSYMRHSKFQTQVAMWLKTRTSFGGQHWNLV